MQADFLLDYDIVTVEQEQKLYLLARLVAGPAPEDTERRPLNLSVVIDRSGSMAGSKIDYTRQAAQLLVQNMSHEDMLSIVLYNEAVETLLPPQNVQHKDMINQRISAIKAGGTTNLSSGWLEGINQVIQNHHPDQVNRVILMSDGLANRGITDADKLVTIARQKLEQGVSTTTMGLGEDFNEDLMMAIADAGGGAFYFIESPEVAPAIFQEELKGLLSVVGQNLTITLEYANQVKYIKQLNAYPAEARPQAITYKLGDVFGDEVKTLMLELSIPAMQQLGKIQIATLRFEYDELTDSETQRQSIEMPVFINVSAQDIGLEAKNPEVTRAVLLLKAAEARREAVRLADQGRYEDAATVLKNAAAAIRNANLNDAALEEERGALLIQANDMERGADYYRSYSRKSMSTQAYFTTRGVHENTQALRLREKRRQDTQGNEVVDYEAVPIDNNEDNLRNTNYFENPLPPKDAPPTRPHAKNQKVPTHVRWGDKTFALDRELLRIGRAPQNEIVINTTGVSRFHAQIKRDGDNYTLEDLGSTNGTHIGGQPLDKPTTVYAGDVAYLCDQRITFEAP